MAKNEPEVPKLISGNTLFHVPTTAMRSAPEVLIQELMKFVFFENTKRPQAQYTTPQCDGEAAFTDIEKFTINAFRGRQKDKGKNNYYYAPAYPKLTRQTWLRNKDPITVTGFLFDGPICHYFKQVDDSENKIKKFSNKLVNSLAGDSEREFGSEKKLYKEIFTRDDNTAACDMLSIAQAEEKLNDYLCKEMNKIDVIESAFESQLAKRITLDFVALIDLEKEMPRLYWVSLLMGFLRVSMSMWFMHLADNIIKLEHLLSKSLNGKKTIENTDDIGSMINHKSILIPSYLGSSNGAESHIKRWVQARIRLTLILNHLIEINLITQGESENALVFKSKGKESLDVDTLLRRVEAGSDDLNKFTTVLVRKCGEWPMYRNPLKVGQGKNAKEFSDVINKSEGFDERASHCMEKTRNPHDKRRWVWRVAPGQLLLQMFVYFSFLENSGDKETKRGLILKDIEDHFHCYGIDFTQAADGRKLLIDRLAVVGLLESSPDAGECIKVNSPFTTPTSNPYDSDH